MTSPHRCQICNAPIWRPRSTETGCCEECRCLIGPIPKTLSERRRAVVEERLRQLDAEHVSAGQMLLVNLP